MGLPSFKELFFSKSATDSVRLELAAVQLADAKTAQGLLLNASQLAMVNNHNTGENDTPVFLNGIDLNDLANEALDAPNIYLKGLTHIRGNGLSHIVDDIPFRLGNSDITGGILDEAKIGIDLIDTQFAHGSAQRLQTMVHIQESEIESTNFLGSKIAESNILESNAGDCVFAVCDLRNVDFDSTILSSALMPIETFFQAKNTNWMQSRSNNGTCYFCFGTQLITDLQFGQSGELVVEALDNDTIEWKTHKLTQICKDNGTELPKKNAISVTSLSDEQLVEFGLPQDIIGTIRAVRDFKNDNNGGGQPIPPNQD